MLTSNMHCLHPCIRHVSPLFSFLQTLPVAKVSCDYQLRMAPDQAPDLEAVVNMSIKVLMFFAMVGYPTIQYRSAVDGHATSSSPAKRLGSSICPASAMEQLELQTSAGL